VPRAIITHGGSQIVRGDERRLVQPDPGNGKQLGVDVRIAHDGMEVAFSE
jgi:hypothetical protein